MKKAAFALSLFLVGCATVQTPPPDPKITIQIDSEPRGERVFFGAGPSSGVANRRPEFVGVTPCEFTPPQEDGVFIGHGIIGYSMFVPSTIVLTAEPSTEQTNLFKRHVSFHTGAFGQAASRVPAKVFFDLTKPDEH